MNSWHERPRAAFDLETTGRDPLDARIVTATIVVVDAAGEVIEQHEWLADPAVEIPDGAAAIHGVTTEQARASGRPAPLVVREIASVLTRLFDAGVPVLAYNARYDFTVLAEEGLRHAVATPDPSPVIDPYIMDKQADRYRKGKRTLTALCDHYGIAFENAHTSAADVLATLRVGQVLAERYAFLQRPAEPLHQALVVWADRQAANFEEYLRRTDPDAVIERAWPILGRGSAGATAPPPVAAPIPAQITAMVPELIAGPIPAQIPALIPAPLAARIPEPAFVETEAHVAPPLPGDLADVA